MKDTLVIGVVAKPQGIKGELKITPYTDDVKRFNNLKSVIIDDKTYSVVHSKACGDFAVISIDGITDRNSAELFRGKYVSVDRENAVKLPQGRYFIVDIIGLDLYVDGGKFGKIIDLTTAKTDIITALTGEGRVLRFPFLNDLVEKVDIENGVMTVSGKRLNEVAVYEN